MKVRTRFAERAQSQSLFVAALLILAAQGTWYSNTWALGVHSALVASSTTVQPGSEFEVRLVVPQSGMGFAGFDAYITYDPKALTFVPSSPTALQQGQYMLSVCGNTWHYFQQQTGQKLWSEVVLMCGPGLLTGPGEIYKLRFRAAFVPQATQVAIDSICFYDGVYILPNASTTNLTINIRNSTDVTLPAARSLSLYAAPNPFNPNTVIHVGVPTAGVQSLLIYDTRGRQIRSLQHGYFEAGFREVVWDGRDDRGIRLPSGVYLVSLILSGESTSHRVVLLE